MQFDDWFRITSPFPLMRVKLSSLASISPWIMEISNNSIYIERLNKVHILFSLGEVPGVFLPLVHSLPVHLM